MKGTTKTRTQRRMEKRQAIILLVLVLAVSLASFTLGVMVGRRGAERDLAQRMLQTEKVLVAEIPPHATVPAAVAEAAPASEDAPSAVPTEEKKLSFYDDLAKDTVPLGSGINLAPAEDQPKTETAVRPPVDLPDKPIVEKEPPPAEKNQVAAVKETKKTGCESGGSHCGTAENVSSWQSCGADRVLQFGRGCHRFERKNAETGLSGVRSRGRPCRKRFVVPGTDRTLPGCRSGKNGSKTVARPGADRWVRRPSVAVGKEG